MPHYYLHGVGCNVRGLGELFTTVRPGNYDAYRAVEPMIGFPNLPVTTMVRTGGVSKHQDDLVDMVKAKDPNYVEFYVQSNYNGGLDLSLRIGGVGPYFVYDLIMPSTIPNPSPIHWHYATGRNYRKMNYDFVLEPEDPAFFIDFDE